MAGQTREELEALLEDPDFLDLSARTKEFNLFEAVGAARYEVRHSKFLASILNPNGAHGLEETFLREFLSRATENAPLDSELNSLRFRVMDLQTVEVRNEWRNMDLVILDEEHEWVCCIENKTGASEHGDQLRRYRKTLEEDFPEYVHLFLYLTPEGTDPSDDAYVPVTYDTVLDALDSVRRRNRESLDDRTTVILEDYRKTVRRHVLMSPEIADICQEIYARHKDAIDLIIEHRPSVLDEAQAHMEEVLPRLCRDYGLVRAEDSRSILRFLPEELDSPGLRISDWTDSGRILLCQIDFRGGKVVLNLTLGPGDQEFRQQVYEWLTEQEPPFVSPSGDSPKKKWQRLYRETLYDKEELEEIHLEEGKEEVGIAVEEEIRARLDDDFPPVLQAIEASEWFRKRQK